MVGVEDMTHVANDLLEQMKTSIMGIDLGSGIDLESGLSFGGANVLTMVILPIALVILGAILIYDLVSLYEIYQLQAAAAGTGRRGHGTMLLSPLLLQSAGDLLGLTTGLGDLVEYRSLDSWDPILNGLQLAYEKFGGGGQYHY